MVDPYADCMSEEEYLRNRNNADQILPNLYLSGMQPTFRLDYLKELKIDVIFTAADSIDPSFPNDFEYKVLEVDDDASVDLLKHFPSAIEFIQARIDQGKTVLVHCAAGVSRSASVVTSFVMHKLGLRRDEALAFVRKSRPAVHPNDGFMA